MNKLHAVVQLRTQCQPLSEQTQTPETGEKTKNWQIHIHFVHKSNHQCNCYTCRIFHHLKYLYLDNAIHVGSHFIFLFFPWNRSPPFTFFRIISIEILSNLRHCILHLKEIDFDPILLSRILEHIQSVPFNCTPIHSRIFKSKYMLMSPMTWTWTFRFNENAENIPAKEKMNECSQAMDRIKRTYQSNNRNASPNDDNAKNINRTLSKTKIIIKVRKIHFTNLSTAQFCHFPLAWVLKHETIICFFVCFIFLYLFPFVFCSVEQCIERECSMFNGIRNYSFSECCDIDSEIQIKILLFSVNADGRWKMNFYFLCVFLLIIFFFLILLKATNIQYAIVLEEFIWFYLILNSDEFSIYRK